MDQPAILIIAFAYLVLVLTTVTYLFRVTLPNLGNTILTFLGLAVSIGSLYVAIATYEKAIKDSKEQQKNLEASQKQLQAVVDAAITQQGILNRNLEISQAQQALLNQSLQTSKLQQEIQSKNLVTSKAQLTHLQEQSKREVETAKTQQDVLNRNLETSQAQQVLLNKSLQISEVQQEIQRKNLETSTAQLMLQQEQNKREQERQARRPIAEIEISTSGGIKSMIELEKLPPLGFELEKGKKWSRMVIIVSNKGNIEVSRPTIIISASPQTVFIDHADFRQSERYEHYKLEFGSPDAKDIDPLEISQLPYSYPIDITVPDSIEAFDLSVSVYGGNLTRIERKIHLMVKRQSLNNRSKQDGPKTSSENME